MTHVPRIGRRRLTRISTYEIRDTRVATEDQIGKNQGPEAVQPIAGYDVTIGDLRDGASEHKCCSACPNRYGLLGQAHRRPAPTFPAGLRARSYRRARCRPGKRCLAEPAA